MAERLLEFKSRPEPQLLNPLWFATDSNESSDEELKELERFELQLLVDRERLENERYALLPFGVSKVESEAETSMSGEEEGSDQQEDESAEEEEESLPEYTGQIESDSEDQVDQTMLYTTTQVDSETQAALLSYEDFPIYALPGTQYFIYQVPRDVTVQQSPVDDQLL